MCWTIYKQVKITLLYIKQGPGSDYINGNEWSAVSLQMWLTQKYDI